MSKIVLSSSHAVLVLFLGAVGVGTVNAADPVPPDLFTTLPGLEVTVWAQSPMLRNPTNMDVDKDGRVWVAEGVNYRGHYGRRSEGDRIVVLEDTDRDGVADRSWTFVQEKALVAPLGVAVFDNKIVVSQTPDLIVYTDVNRNLKFDPGTDTREVLLTGFNGSNHDHSLHSVHAGPDGMWYYSAGNCGAQFTDNSGQTFRIGSPYRPGATSKFTPMLFDPTAIAGMKSDDGRVWIGGFAARMNPDGTGTQILGHNFRNSYEQTVTSFGDLFQNDNDDPPACRVAWVMEGGNAGFASADGQRSWQADRRPGQDTPTAEWRQEDPGTMPAGDIYGGGSPTGIAFYENGALGKGREGMLLSCEAGRNVVFGYKPRLDAAGFKLERFDFLTSNKQKKFAGSDFLGGNSSVTREIETLFRPSDVCVGPDGAVYVSDWFDPRVGGHADLDESASGAIYRIAPTGFKPNVPKLELNSDAGRIAALRSPAVNVRTLGFNALKDSGAASVAAVLRLLNDKNPYMRGRAIWLLSNLGPAGIAKVEAALEDPDPNIRIAAFRALRKQGHQVIQTARVLAADPAPAVRREVALAMRDVSLPDAMEILASVAREYDGRDRYYLEAIGLGAQGRETEVYDAIAAGAGMDSSDPVDWPPAFARIAWRLHPPSTVDAFKARALSPALSSADRKAALAALGFIYTRAAVDAVIQVAAAADGAVRAEAIWWLLNQSNHHWNGFGIPAALKERGIYDPDTVQIIPIMAPPPSGPPTLNTDRIAGLTGNLVTGKQIVTACFTCHKIGEVGVDYAPNLSDWTRTQTTEVIIRSIIDPSADIAHGYDGWEIVTKGGATIHGLVLSSGDPVMVQSMGGIMQTIPKKRIQSMKRLDRSLMLSAEQLGLSEQLVADLVAYLKSL